MGKSFPFLISKAMFSSIESVKSIKELCSGTTLVDAMKAPKVKFLLSTKTLGHLEVRVKLHHTINNFLGDRRCHDLWNVPEDIITPRLADEVVVATQHTTMKLDEVSQPSDTLVVNFNQHKVQSPLQ